MKGGLARILAGRGDRLRLWAIATGKLLVEGNREQPADLVECLAFSPAGKKIVSPGKDNILLLWNAATGQQLWSQSSGPISALAFDPDRKTLAALDDHGISL